MGDIKTFRGDALTYATMLEFMDRAQKAEQRVRELEREVQYQRDRANSALAALHELEVDK